MASARAPEEALTPARLAIVLVLAAPLLFLGCGGDTPTKPKTSQYILYPIRSTPKNAVLYMAVAFANRDTVRTDSVYADDYEGASTDLTDLSPTTFVFFKSDEIRALGNMARSNSITLVQMDLGSPAGWLQVHNLADPPDWTTIQVPSFHIYVNDTVEGELSVRAPASGQINVFEFTLRPTTPDPTSPTDTTWAIVRWRESRAQL